MCLTGGEGDENMGGGGITPISVTPRLSCISPESEMSKKARRENKIFSSRIHILWNRRHSPLCWVWPLGVTLSLGSIERGFTASVTGKNISQLLTWRLWMSQSEIKTIIKMWRKKRRGLTKTKDELGLDSAMHGLQQRFTKQTLDFWHSHLNYANCNCCKTALLENNSRICGSNIYAPIQLEPILCIFCNFEIEGLLKWFSVDIVLEELYQKLRAKINRPEIAFLWLLQKM